MRLSAVKVFLHGLKTTKEKTFFDAFPIAGQGDFVSHGHSHHSYPIHISPQ